MRARQLAPSLAALLISILLGCSDAGTASGDGDARSMPARSAERGAAAPASSPASDRDPIFVDATASAGLDFVHRNGMTGDRWFVEMMGSGAALLDYDGDGDLDLFLVQGGSLDSGARAGEEGDRLFRNDLEAGTVRLIDVTAESGIAESGYGMGVATGDYDGDGQVDLYVTNWGSNELWRNRGGGRFEARGAAAGVDDPGWSVPAVFLDFDRDGALDLFVGNYVDFTEATHKRCLSALGVLDYCGPLTFQAQPDVLYRNRGDGTFTDVSGAAGLRSAPPRPALGALAGDFDADGWLDLYVTNDQTVNYLWRGTGDGRLSEDALGSGCAVDAQGKPQASMGVTAGDADGDGDEDLFITHLNEEHHTLYTNNGKAVFEDTSGPSGLVTPTWSHTGFGTGWIDYDGDGLLDLLAVSGAVKSIPEQVAAGDLLPLRQPGLLLRNLGNGRFTEVVLPAEAPLRSAIVGRGLALGDIDNDGDTDAVACANAGPARLLLNQMGNRLPWIGLRAVERTVQGVDRDVLDAWVGVRRAGGQPVLWRRVRTAGSYASASDPRLLVGLGEGGVVAGIEVRWPDGTTESWGGLEVGRYHVLRRGEGS
jgi:hypothetical protein